MFSKISVASTLKLSRKTILGGSSFQLPIEIKFLCWCLLWDLSKILGVAVFQEPRWCFMSSYEFYSEQKQPNRGVLRKMYSENMKHICRKTPMQKYYFYKAASQHYWKRTCSPVNLLRIFRTTAASVCRTKRRSTKNMSQTCGQKDKLAEPSFAEHLLITASKQIWYYFR